jgi:thiol-disulfide isomerase/thioredoxin
MRLLCLFLMLFPNAQHSTKMNKPDKVHVVKSFVQFEPYLHRESDTLYVVNFWATWCVPCVKELPAFEKIHEKYSDKKVKVLLVSLDMADQVKNRLIPFLQKNNFTSDVVLLDDPHQNQWIDKVDAKWSGAIPFTVVYNKNSRESYERSFRFNELDSIIKFKLSVP